MEEEQKPVQAQPAEKTKLRRKESKQAVRNRVRRFRQKKAEEAEAAIEAAKQLQEIIERQQKEDVVWFAELRPNEPCKTADDELEMASEFAEALQQEGRRDDETIKSFVLRIFREWCEQGCKMLDRKTKTLSWGLDEPDFSKYVWPPGVE